jgi:acyl-CoA thioesterase-1
MRIRQVLSLALALSAAVALVACGGEEGAGSFEGPANGSAGVPEASGPDLVRPGDSEGSSVVQPSAGGGGPTNARVRVTFLGTSLSEGLGLEQPAADAWPARIGELADSAGIAVEIVNAGIGGETSAGALARLDWVLQGEPDVLVVETGANDGLRGLPVEQLESNLTEIVRVARERDPSLSVAIVQMEAPTNMGAGYTNAFRAAFPEVAERMDVPLIPFLLEGVGGIPELNQGDGIHPNVEGHRILARNVWPALEPLLRAAVQAEAQSAAPR